RITRGPKSGLAMTVRRCCRGTVRTHGSLVLLASPLCPYPAPLAGEGRVAAFFRGGPISTGWNSTAAAIVQTRDNAINLPILAVPGWLDSHKPPNAVAVVSALKTTALVRLDCSKPVLPARQAMM